MSMGLVFGKCLEKYYRSPSIDIEQHIKDSLSWGRAEFFKEDESDPKREADWEKLTKVAWGILPRYPDWARGKDDFSIVAIETPCRALLSSDVGLLAIPDTVVLEQETTLILEHKLRHRYHLGDFGIDYQSVGCCLVTGAVGTLYNVIEYSKPKNPFHRDLIIRSDFELCYFRDMFIHMGEDILSTPPERMYPSPMKRCSCEYWELCNSEKDSLDVEEIISELYLSTVQEETPLAEEVSGEPDE